MKSIQALLLFARKKNTGIDKHRETPYSQGFRLTLAVDIPALGNDKMPSTSWQWTVSSVVAQT